MYGVATVVMIIVFECYKNDIFLSIYVGTGISLNCYSQKQKQQKQKQSSNKITTIKISLKAPSSCFEFASIWREIYLGLGNYFAEL